MIWLDSSGLKALLLALLINPPSVSLMRAYFSHSRTHLASNAREWLTSVKYNWAANERLFFQSKVSRKIFPEFFQTESVQSLFIQSIWEELKGSLIGYSLSIDQFDSNGNYLTPTSHHGVFLFILILTVLQALRDTAKIIIFIKPIKVFNDFRNRNPFTLSLLQRSWHEIRK